MQIKTMPSAVPREPGSLAGEEIGCWRSITQLPGDQSGEAGGTNILHRDLQFESRGGQGHSQLRTTRGRSGQAPEAGKEVATGSLWRGRPLLHWVGP